MPMRHHSPSPRNPLKVYCGTANPALAQAVAKRLDMPLGAVTVKRFPDDEMYVKFDESVRGAETFLIQPTCPPPRVGREYYLCHPVLWVRPAGAQGAAA
jgi:hypothetical protein